MNINKEIQNAFEHYQSGNLQLAKSISNKIIREQPDNSEVIHFLGIIYLDLELFDKAIECINKAIKLNPDNAHAYFHLGNALRGKGQSEEVIIAYQKAMQLKPNYTEVYNNLGNLLQEKGQLNEAIPYYKKAIEIDPDFADAYYNLGNVFQHTEQFDEAKACYKKSIEIDPEYADAYYNLGYIFTKEKNHDEAIRYYQKTVELSPASPEVFNSLGNAFHEKGLLDEAEFYYQKAIMLDPSFAVSYYNLGNTLWTQGKRNEARDAYEKAIESNPRYTRALWARCMAELQIIYSDEESISATRKQYHEALIKLCKTVSLETEQDIEMAADAIGMHQPFFLPYQGINDRELQQIYGDFVSKIIALKYPQWVNTPSLPPLMPGEPIRVGIVSRYFYYHSNWKIPIKGWIENIDKQRFKLYGYFTGKIKDSETDIARKSFSSFIEDIYSLDKLCQIISDDKLHVLIFPECGMDPMTLKLASLRLAPVQCASWGHPETSGLPTIDYFISSELMEPPDADDHYSEQLIRLPNLSIHYSPLDVQTMDADRNTFGMRSDSIIYLCAQSLFKYLPQYDWIFPLIAKEIKDCQFLFISDNSSVVTEFFRSRISKEFKHMQLSADEHVTFLPRLDPVQYHSVNTLADICLDSIGWSGCNSTFEAIACNLPLVTLPGNLMRGRHTSAILTMMGLRETISSTPKKYVELAVRLGKDREYRHHISKKIAANKHRIYCDKESVTGLEEFIINAVEKKL